MSRVTNPNFLRPRSHNSISTYDTLYWDLAHLTDYRAAHHERDSLLALVASRTRRDKERLLHTLRATPEVRD